MLQAVPRKEGPSKLRGEAKYIDDLTFPGMIYGTTVRTPCARGRIKKIHFDPRIAWNEFTIVTAQDIPGQNYVALIEKDQPYLAADFFNHKLEPVVLLAHPDRVQLERARQAVRIEVEELPAVLSLEESLSAQTIIWGKDNILKSFLVEKGSLEDCWGKADFVIDGEYETGAQEQLYIENNGMIADCQPGESVTVWGSMQCPYYVHKALTPLFNLPEDKIRVVQTETGGGFGGKEEFPSVIAGHAALLSWKAGKPVKLIYSRSEDMACTTKRHPSRSRIRTAVDKSGKLLGIDFEFLLDGGAYATLSAVVLSRGTIHAAGPYRCENVRIRAKALATNSPPHGAFRGFGAPQSIFAMERHMDKIAAILGMHPDELRMQNLLKKGERTATNQEVKEDPAFPEMLDKALTLTDFREKRKAYANQPADSEIRRGIGLACFMHGAGFTGSGEKYLASVVNVQLAPEGKLRVHSASTEIGQGTQTIFSQIVAEAVGIHYEDVVVAQPDTRTVPNSGPTVASRTCMVVGNLVRSAALGIRDTLVKSGMLPEKYTRAQFLQACSDYHTQHGSLISTAQYHQPPGINWDDQKYQGDAYATYAWAVYVAEVTVNTITYETKVEDFVAVQEVGRVVHPVLASGQIEGGVAQAIGYALYEKVVWRDGVMINNQMTNYIMPTSMDTPDIRVYFLEKNKEHGPGGAKGIGELPMDGPAPAILNAVQNATGVSVQRIPMLPEDLAHEMESQLG